MEDKGNVASGKIVSRPGAGSSYENAWRQMWKYFLELFLILIVSVIISSPSGMREWVPETSAAVGLLSGLGFIYSVLISGPMGYGVSYASLKAARGDKVEVADMFAAFRNYWNAVLASILVGAIIVVGLVLLIVPGIIFACKLAFTPYLVVDRKMEVVEAVKTSWNMTNGYAGEVFLIGLLAIPIFIAGAICFGVGVIAAAIWVSLAFASLYHAVSVSGGQTWQPPAA